MINFGIRQSLRTITMNSRTISMNNCMFQSPYSNFERAYISEKSSQVTSRKKGSLQKSNQSNNCST